MFGSWCAGFIGNIWGRDWEEEGKGAVDTGNIGDGHDLEESVIYWCNVGHGNLVGGIVDMALHV